MTFTTITAEQMQVREAESIAAALRRGLDVTKLERHVQINVDDEVRVRVTFSGPNLDRTDGYAWSLGPTTPARKRLALRLVAGIEAGAVLGDPEPRVDIADQTYVHVPSKILGRTMNADLTRLGF